MYKAYEHLCIMYKGYLHPLYQLSLPVPFPKPDLSLQDSQDGMTK